MLALQTNRSQGFAYEAPFIENQDGDLLASTLSKLLETIDRSSDFEHKMSVYTKALDLIQAYSNNRENDPGYPGIVMTRFYIDLAWFYLHNANGYGMCESSIDWDAYVDAEFLEKALDSLNRAEKEFALFVLNEKSSYRTNPEIQAFPAMINRLRVFCQLKAKVSFSPV